MNLEKLPNNYQQITLDTNIFVYYFGKHSKLHVLAEELFLYIVEKQIRISTSILSLTELLSLKTDEANIKKLEDGFTQIPNLTVLEVNREIATLAAKIRREYKFLLPDAIQLATAAIAKADIFITNDARLQKFKEIKVVLLTKFAKK